MYLLFFPNSDQHDLLKEEIKIKLPTLKLSFSTPGMISMKSEKDIPIEKLQRQNFIYTKRIGIFKEKLSAINDLKKDEDFFEVKDNQFWLYQVISTKFDRLKAPSFKLPTESPSRSWLKMKEAHHFFNLPLKNEERVVEIGCAPGGISLYLLSEGLLVYAIDPASMSDMLLQKYPDRFHHLKKSIFDIQKKDLPKDFEWIIVDLNLKGDLSIQQALRISKMTSSLKGIFMTVKTPKIQDVKKIDMWKKSLRKLKNFKLYAFQLPSHHREVGFILTKV